MKSSQCWRIKTIDGNEIYAHINCEITQDTLKEILCDLVKEAVAITREEYIEATGEDI